MKRKKSNINGIIRKRADQSSNFCCTDCRFTSKGHYSCNCPHCHNRMLSMGIRFQMPRKEDDRAWKKLEKIEIEYNNRQLREDMKRAEKARNKKEEYHFAE